ncbi:MAG: diadenylate cyclase CdaA [bacterium]|nr:diadenylate cyclase CdaA [bacterium]
MNFYKTISLIDVLDILVLATVFYQVILIFQRTRATHLLLGIFYFAVLFFLAYYLQMTATFWVFEKLASLLAIALLIIFQPELRNFFERAGRRGFLLAAAAGPSGDREDVEQLLDTIVQALEEMSEEHTGALIVIEREISLTEYINTGERINAEVSKELLKSIFYKGNPLHDGAVIIREGRIASARAFLKLTDSKDLPSHLGTRHRAAMGITEASDAISLVASEETGHLSLFHSGKPAFRLTPNTMRLMARGIIIPETGQETPIHQFRQGINRYFKKNLTRQDKAKFPEKREKPLSTKIKIPVEDRKNVDPESDTAISPPIKRGEPD